MDELEEWWWFLENEMELLLQKRKQFEALDKTVKSDDAEKNKVDEKKPLRSQ